MTRRNKKGVASEIMMAVFSIGIGMILLVLVLPQIAGPTLKVYSQENANINAFKISSAINALSTEDSGKIEMLLGGMWDISSYEKDGMRFLRLSHSEESRLLCSGMSVILGSADEIEDMYYVNNIALEKMPGGPVKVVRVS